MSAKEDRGAPDHARPVPGDSWPVDGTAGTGSTSQPAPRTSAGPAAAAAAPARRRLARSVAGLGLVAAAAITASIVLGDDPTRPSPTPTPTSTATGPATPELVHDRASGTRLVLLPDDAALAALPPAPAASLPPDLPLGDEDDQIPLTPTDGLGGRRLVAAWTDPLAPGAMVVVLLADGSRHVLPRISAPQGRTGHPATVLPQRAIGADGQRVFYVQDGMLLVVGTGEPLSSALRPRAHVSFQVVDGAWTPGGEGIVLVGEHDRLFVDVVSGATRILSEPAPGGYYELSVDGRPDPPAATLSTWSAAANRTGAESYPLPVSAVLGPTFSSLSGWATAAVRPRIEGILSRALPEPQAGVAAVSGDSPNRKELLVDAPRTEAQVRCPGCIEPVGWASGTDVLVRVRGVEDLIVRWSTVSGRLWRESRIVGGALRSLAVQPGS